MIVYGDEVFDVEYPVSKINFDATTPAAYRTNEPGAVNIPLPTVPPELKIAICNAGRQVIDVRTTFPNETLASLYSPVGMHPELIRAHEYLDTLVDKAFGLSQPAKDEAERLTLLFKLYAEKTKGE